LTLALCEGDNNIINIRLIVFIVSIVVAEGGDIRLAWRQALAARSRFTTASTLSYFEIEVATLVWIARVVVGISLVQLELEKQQFIELFKTQIDYSFHYLCNKSR